MTDQATNFSKLNRVAANIKIWENDLKGIDDGPLKSELLFNIAPILKEMVNAFGEELSEQATLLADQADALEEMIDQEGDFLQPDTANDIKATFTLGLAIIDILESEGVVLENELKNKQLKDGIKLYVNNTAILLDHIESITNEDEDDDNNEGADGVRAEAGHAEEHDGGGAGSAQGNGGGDAGAGAGTGAGTGTGTGTGSSSGSDADADANPPEDEESEG